MANSTQKLQKKWEISTSKQKFINQNFKPFFEEAFLSAGSREFQIWLFYLLYNPVFNNLEKLFKN